MKKRSLAVLILILVIALPASCDQIVTGLANSYFFGGQTFLSGALCQVGIGPPARDVDKVVWDDGRYNVTVELWASCSGPWADGVHTIDVITSVSGQLSTPYIYYEPWTVQSTASGMYTYFDGGTESLYFFSGPAIFNLVLVSGSDIEFEMSFAANAPTPVPEPASLILLSTGLVGIFRRARQGSLNK